MNADAERSPARAEAPGGELAPALRLSGSPHVLAILLGLIGDTLMRVPAVRAVRLQWPEAHITALCDPLTAPAQRIKRRWPRTNHAVERSDCELVWRWDRREQ